jgi:hypothetical protein
MKTAIKYLTIALTSMAVMSGCVEEGTPADQDGAEELEEYVGTAIDDSPGDFEAAARSLQQDCGLVTCTVRLNRAWTKKAQSASAITTISSAACNLIGSPPGIVVCKAALKGIGVVVSNRAKKYYAAGNCIGIRYPKVGGPGVPVEVKLNSYNCQ